jgi:hypothetical protein
MTSVYSYKPQFLKKGDIMGHIAVPSGGDRPSGTISITTNGVHDVKKYASANVNVNRTPTQHIVSVGSIGKNSTSINVSSYEGYQNFTKYNFFLDVQSCNAWTDSDVSAGTTSYRPFTISYNQSSGVLSLTYGNSSGHAHASFGATVYLVYYD